MYFSHSYTFFAFHPIFYDSHFISRIGLRIIIQSLFARSDAFLYSINTVCFSVTKHYILIYIKPYIFRFIKNTFDLLMYIYLIYTSIDQMYSL